MRLPFPPSQNTAWRSVAIAGRVRVLLSAKGRAYRATVAAHPEVRAHPRLGAARLRLVLTLCPPDRRPRDLDNHVKQVVDGLMHACLFDDDSQIDELVILRGSRQVPGCVAVELAALAHSSHVEAPREIPEGYGKGEGN